MPRIAAERRQRYGAIRRDGSGLAPRDYPTYEWLMPRQLDEGEAERGTCPEGQHSCEDIQRPSSCCSSDEFCFISNITDTSGSYPASCCKFGNSCAKENQCNNPNYFLDVKSVTVTVQITTSATITQAPSVTTATSCQLRACQLSEYQCPESLGHGCCPLSQSCMLNRQCGTFIASPTTVVTIKDPNCSVGYYSCVDKEAGCCANGAVCTVVSNEGRCASASASATGVRNPGNFTEVTAGPPGTLSGGAKAGIGVGVTLGALLILLVTIWWIRRRNRRREAARSETASTALQDGMPMTTIDHTSPGPSGVGSAGRAWRGGRGEGGAQDYFGPAPRAGPFTGDGDQTPGPSDEVSPGQWGRGAVPISPDGPSDIVPAVEIGGGERRPTLGREGDGSGQGSDVAVVSHGNARQESRQLEEVGVDGQGVEPAPSYVDSTSGIGVGTGTGTAWTREESNVAWQHRRERSDVEQEVAKDVPEAPHYRHELP